MNLGYRTNEILVNVLVHVAEIPAHLSNFHHSAELLAQRDDCATVCKILIGRSAIRTVNTTTCTIYVNYVYMFCMLAAGR